MSGVVPLLPLYAFMMCTEKTVILLCSTSGTTEWLAETRTRDKLLVTRLAALLTAAAEEKPLNVPTFDS
jgi:hypothetical protein